MLDVAGEAWIPKTIDLATLAAPGQRWPDERYLERCARITAAVRDQGFKGLTTDGQVVPGLFPLRPTAVSTQPIRAAAEALLEALDAEQRAQAVFAIDAPEWHLWHGLFTRLLRHGVPVEAMTTRQRGRLEQLIEASLSAAGAAAVRDIRTTNQLAAELTGLFMDLGQDQYWLSIFGTPSDDEPWGWQLDGHHVNINYAVLGDQVVMTPTFLGAEPTTVRTGPLGGIRLFGAEEADGLRLMQSLSPSQRRQATLAENLAPELFTGFFRDNIELGYQGVSAATFTDVPRQLLVQLAANYAGYLRPGHAEVWIDQISEHLPETYFAWIGAVDDVQPFYYRVQSPVVLIEFSHIFGVAMVGDGASRNHIHTIVRSPNGNDYGKDLLRQHIELHHLGG
jgi:hypothetical protein